jgi:PAS domain S-box-containing protein
MKGPEHSPKGKPETGIPSMVALDAVEDMVFIVDTGGKIMLANKATADRFGIPSEELTGKAILDLFPPDVADARRRRGLEAMTSGEAVHFVDSRGGRFFENSIYPIFGESGNVTSFAVLGRDITERKRAVMALRESEEKYRHLVNNTDTGFVVINDSGIVLEANEPYVKIIGASKAEDVLGHSVIEWTSPDEVDNNSRAVALCASQGFIQDFETSYIGKNGEKVSVIINATVEESGGVKRLVSFCRDITERKQAEEALKVAKNYLDSLLNATPDPIFMKDREHKWVLLNDAFCSFMGHGRAELIGRSDYDFFPKEEADVFWEKDELVFTTRQENVNEEAFTDASGFKHIILTKKVLFTDVRGRDLLIGSIRDITYRKKAEEALKESENRIRKVFEASPVAMVESRVSDGTVLMANRRLGELFGVDVGKLTGLKTPEFYLNKTERDTILAELRERKTIYDREIRVKKADGTSFWCVVSLQLSNMDGEDVLLAGFEDISERKATEEALRENEAFLNSVVENIPDMIFVKDAQDLRFARFNKAGEDLLGYTRGDLIGKNDYDFFPKVEADFFTGKDMEVLDSRKLLDIPEETIQTRHLGQRILHTKKIPILGPEGNPRYLLGISEDITERRRAVEAIKAAHDELARSNRELEQFAYVASHDLQEPLRSVASFSQLLRRQYDQRLDGDAREYLQFIIDGSSRMQTMIDDLLQLSRVGTRGKPFVPTNTGVALQKALENLSARISETGAKIERGNMPVVTADPVQLVQLFQNLVGNAIKFRGDNTPTIHIGAELCDGEWVFSVKDNGIGIEPQYHERIFVVFQRLHRRKDYPGTGIGLAVCKKIVERHGGRIWVESAPGAGSTFRFTIPD